MSTGSNHSAARHKTVIYYITEQGSGLARRLKGLCPDAELIKFNTAVFSEMWPASRNIICIMATGIVVRALCSLLKDKKTDPAVVVLDEKGEYAVSLLSGHLGGANTLARQVADFLETSAVITTASDVQGKVALDLWAAEKNLYVEDYNIMKTLSTKIVNGHKATLKTSQTVSLSTIPEEFEMLRAKSRADITITSRITGESSLFLRPKNLFLGIGCNRNTSRAEIEETVHCILHNEKLSPYSVAGISSIDLKKDEQGLLEFAAHIGIETKFYSKSDLNETVSKNNLKTSEAVMSATGAAAVAEPAAILAAADKYNNGTIIVHKVKRGNVTLAIAEAKLTL